MVNGVVLMQHFYTRVLKALSCLIHTFTLELLTAVLSLFDVAHACVIFILA